METEDNKSKKALIKKYKKEYFKAILTLKGDKLNEKLTDIIRDSSKNGIDIVKIAQDLENDLKKERKIK